MASQRITLAKLGGAAADLALMRLSDWASARSTADPNEWSSDQWPDGVRQLADGFADRLRAHAHELPVVHFIEWFDLWSMGDLFERWLRPADGPLPKVVWGDRYQVFAFALPDGGRLAQMLRAAGHQQFDETDWFIARLLEAIAAWEKLVQRSLLVVLRDVVGPTAFDDEVTASLQLAPNWISSGLKLN